MTVSSTTNRKSFTGDAVTTSFGTSPVVFFNSSELVVQVITTATGAATTLTENTHYSVTGGSGSTGTVSLAGGSAPYGAPSASQTLVIRRVLPYTQADDFVNNDINDAEVTEDRFDKTVMQIQQLSEELGRAIKVSTLEEAQADFTVAGKGGYYLRRNSGNTAWELAVGDVSTDSFTQSGTGAVARSVTSKLAETVSVKDFGAVGDGVANDTAAIQAAHDACVAGAYSAVVFPAGTYQFTTLTWSPHVGARSVGKVYLRTANASGRTIQISDQYGRPALYGLNAPRNTVFDGQFYLVNTNGSNTAIAWSFGGATNAYYCNLATVLCGVETRGFHGGVYEFRYNAFLLGVVDCFDYGNNGSRVIVESAATNTGEGLRFINTTFGTGSSYVCDIDTANAMQFDFVGCSADYCLGLNAPGNSAPLVKFNWIGGNIEWDTVANAYLQNDSASDWNIDGAMIHVTATSGWPTYVVSVTTGAGTTRFTNIKYVLPGSLNTLHRLVSSTSKGIFDFSPNYQGGNAPTTYVTDSSGTAVVGYDGVTYTASDYTPTVSATLGNGTITGRYVFDGDRVDVNITHVKGSTTSYTAGPLTFGIPILSRSGRVAVGNWLLNNFGIGAQIGFAKVAASASAMTVVNTSGVVIQDTDATAWGNGSQIDISVTYFK